MKYLALIERNIGVLPLALSWFSYLLQCTPIFKYDCLCGKVGDHDGLGHQQAWLKISEKSLSQ
jgi:hypothetical protein